jgi:hypothetical protein
MTEARRSFSAFAAVAFRAGKIAACGLGDQHVDAARGEVRGAADGLRLEIHIAGVKERVGALADQNAGGAENVPGIEQRGFQSVSGISKGAVDVAVDPLGRGCHRARGA